LHLFGRISKTFLKYFLSIFSKEKISHSYGEIFWSFKVTFLILKEHKFCYFLHE